MLNIKPFNSTDETFISYTTREYSIIPIILFKAYFPVNVVKSAVFVENATASVTQITVEVIPDMSRMCNRKQSKMAPCTFIAYN